MSELIDRAVERVQSIVTHFREEIEEQRFHGTIQWFVDDVIRAIMFPELTDEGGRSELGWAASVLSSTMPEFTSIVSVNDSYMATESTKIDGSEWQQGDMAYAINNKTQDAVLIRECLTYMIIEKDAVCMVSLPYERTSSGVVLYDWDHMQTMSTDDDEGGPLLGGEMAYQLRKAFEAPKITNVLNDHNLKPEEYGIDPDIVEVSIMCAGVKLIMEGTEGRYRVMIPARNDTEKEYVRSSFSNDGYGVYDALNGTEL